MNPRNDWLEREMSALKQEMHASKKCSISFKGFALLIGVLTLVLGYTQLQANTVVCPHCENPIELEYTVNGIFPNTWTCSCGYKNYEGISTCANCGKSRKK